MDRNGHVYIADFGHERILKVTPDGRMTSISGPGQRDRGFTPSQRLRTKLGDGGPARHGVLETPSGVALDDKGNLYIADYCNARIRKIWNALPVAWFRAVPARGRRPLTVRFDASASRDPDGSIVSYAWKFGDGATGAGMKTRHTYRRGGRFTVRLAVTDGSGGAPRTFTRRVVVR